MLIIEGFFDKYHRLYLDINNYLENCEWEDIETEFLKLRLLDLLDPYQAFNLDFVNVVSDSDIKKRVIISIDGCTKIFTYVVKEYFN